MKRCKQIEKFYRVFSADCVAFIRAALLSGRFYGTDQFSDVLSQIYVVSSFFFSPQVIFSFL